MLERRLRLDALTEEEFASLVAAPTERHGDDNPPPSWVAAIGRAQAVANPASVAHDPRDIDAGGAELARAFVEPFIATGLAALFARARRIREAHSHAPFDPERATRLFEPALWNHLVNRSLKVAILELNVARVQGSLVGDTPQARYAHFARLLRTTDLRQRILEEYPVLARLLITASRYWEDCAAEFLHHLACDVEQLFAEFGGGEALGTLTELTLGAGDTHRHGRSVMVVAFSSGKRIVYKPRPLAVDLCFEHLVAWINAHGQSPPLRAVRTISYPTHGWAEFASEATCGSREEVARFYERFGSYLALLHALEATDFHYENVIASGEHPMLIDLEALCHPRSTTTPQLDDPEWIGWSALHHSVLRAGMLPFRAFGNAESSGLDMSAVGGGGVQRTPNRLPVLVDAGTDEMRLVRDFVDLPASHNRPTLGTESVDPASHTDHILAGFTTTYRLLVRHREELLAEGGPIRRFANAPIRVVLRPTRQYALILLESYHPDVLRDALDRDRLLDKLWVAVPSRPELESVVGYEHADLVAGDVPLFTSRPDSRDLMTTHGEHIANFFEQSGLDAAISRVRTLSEEDLVRQQWVVRASLTGLSPGRHAAEPSRPDAGHPLTPNAQSAEPSLEACVGAAERVANRLAALALRQNERISWLGLTLARERDWVIQPIGSDLYGGTLGIAFFLAYLADITGNRQHEQLARDVIEQVVSRLQLLLHPDQRASALTPGSLGVFGPLGGAIYTLSHIGVLWRDHRLLDIADALATRVRDEAAVDRNHDIVAGNAGLILALASLHRARPCPVARDVTRVSADRLVEAAGAALGGVAWITEMQATQPLTGFSHGASGIAASLFTAGAMLNGREYTETARAALHYERNTFDAERQNWPDYRVLDAFPKITEPPVMWSWCHGAPGIGLARLITLHHEDDAESASRIHSDLETAIASTVGAGFGSNDSICHGDLGNIELLIRARESSIGGLWEHRLADEASRLVERIGRGDWRCGIPGYLETPGMMMGLAGIGYGLLRIGATERVPSLLSLEAPRGQPLPLSPHAS
jgi:type 2 lantibiotic biosynthesis protein LanM